MITPLIFGQLLKITRKSSRKFNKNLQPRRTGTLHYKGNQILIVIQNSILLTQRNIKRFLNMASTQVIRVKGSIPSKFVSRKKLKSRQGAFGYYRPNHFAFIPGDPELKKDCYSVIEK
ncbi:hypothetical protein Anas_14029 [Armadillidium nasatum]|uniref:Uncharacterized protein n=1 Tax=Armadillidium nasatum TaxID=96803 RepID=A0A5N5T3C2_9CRUS|nr:hypothetical protein Anas_14029 [Armadillidium nasatum]